MKEIGDASGLVDVLISVPEPYWLSYDHGFTWTCSVIENERVKQAFSPDSTNVMRKSQTHKG